MHSPSDPHSVPSASHVPPGPKRDDLCVACGAYHGSVGAELHCLRAALRAARRALAAAPAPTRGSP